jgi:outer membrane protein assembly factor BamB
VLTPRSDVTGNCLRAVRALDGKMLWRSDSADNADKSLASLQFVPGTVCCGRYVYTLATSAPRSMFLIALDITTGRPLWRTLLPSLAADASQFSGPAGMTVDLDQLLLCPNAGCVIAVDRWNGDVRWIHPYPSLGQVDGADAQVGNWGVPPTPRFDNRPYVSGATAFFAPQDAESTFALNSRTGENIWNSSAYSTMTLIGAVDQCAILQGTRILAVQVGAASAAEEIRWSYSPRPESITGPAVIHGDVLFVPTTDKAAIPVSIADGTELMIPPAIRPPNFRAILNTRAAEELLAPRTLGSFGFPQTLSNHPW